MIGLDSVPSYDLASVLCLKPLDCLQRWTQRATQTQNALRTVIWVPEILSNGGRKPTNHFTYHIGKKVSSFSTTQNCSERRRRGAPAPGSSARGPSARTSRQLTGRGEGATQSRFSALPAVRNRAPKAARQPAAAATHPGAPPPPCAPPPRRPGMPPPPCAPLAQIRARRAAPSRPGALLLAQATAAPGDHGLELRPRAPPRRRRRGLLLPRPDLVRPRAPPSPRRSPSRRARSLAPPPAAACSLAFFFLRSPLENERFGCATLLL